MQDAPTTLQPGTPGPQGPLGLEKFSQYSFPQEPVPTGRGPGGVPLPRGGVGCCEARSLDLGKPPQFRRPQELATSLQTASLTSHTASFDWVCTLPKAPQGSLSHHRDGRCCPVPTSAPLLTSCPRPHQAPGWVPAACNKPQGLGTGWSHTTSAEFLKEASALPGGAAAHPTAPLPVRWGLWLGDPLFPSQQPRTSRASRQQENSQDIRPLICRQGHRGTGDGHTAGLRPEPSFWAFSGEPLPHHCPWKTVSCTPNGRGHQDHSVSLAHVQIMATLPTASGLCSPSQSTQTCLNPSENASLAMLLPYVTLRFFSSLRPNFL